MSRLVERARALLQRRPDGWAAAVDTLEDFKPWAKRKLPYVVHTPLHLPTACWDYIEQLDFQRDFSHLSQHTPAHEFREVRRHIWEWDKDPDAACEAFAEASERFFPAAPEQPYLIRRLTEVAHTFARVTGSQQTACEFKAFDDGYQHTNFHSDFGYKHTCGIYLKGPTTAQAIPESVLKRADADSATIDGLELRDMNGRSCGYVPERSIAMWPLKQQHSNPPTTSQRVAIFMLGM